MRKSGGEAGGGGGGERVIGSCDSSQSHSSSGNGDGSSFSMVVSDSPLENIPRRPRSSTVGALSGEKIKVDFRNRDRRTSQGYAAVSPCPSPGGNRGEGKSPGFFQGNGNGGDPGLGSPSPNGNMGSKEQKQHSPMMNMLVFNETIETGKMRDVLKKL